MPADHEPPVPAWVVWTNRAVLTLAGTIAAVMVADYAAASGHALDLALVAVILVATMAAVVWPDRMVPVLAAAVASMLGLALIPPAWLLALVPPLLLTVVRRRSRRQHPPPSGPAPDDPAVTHDTDEDPAP